VRRPSGSARRRSRERQSAARRRRDPTGRGCAPQGRACAMGPSGSDQPVARGAECDLLAEEAHAMGGVSDFPVVEAELRESFPGHRIFAQVRLGEILGSDDDAAYASVNSKRVDILVIDRKGWPAAIIEYQGEGHYQDSADARDAVKRAALRKARIAYVEVFPHHSESDIRREVRDAIGRASVRDQQSGVPVQGDFGTV